MTQANQTQADPSHRPSLLASRRQFLQAGVVALGAAWAGTFVQSKLFVQETGQAGRPVEFSLSELAVGAAKYISYAGAPVIVIRTAESIRAFSLICTHLGCTVQWQEGEKKFYCPCHEGYFDQFGEVVAGPPPAPLEQFPVTVDGDRVIVGEV